MADNIPNIKIDELDTTSSLNNAKDLLVAVHYSTAYSNNRKTVNFHPNTLLSYNNKKSKLNARNYQDAIDEIVNLIAVGETFNVPLSPNPDANALQVSSEPVPTLATFNGNGSTTSFTIDTALTITSIASVLVNYAATSDYTFDGNKTVTFTSAPPSGTGNIHIHYWAEYGG